MCWPCSVTSNVAAGAPATHSRSVPLFRVHSVLLSLCALGPWSGVAAAPQEEPVRAVPVHALHRVEDGAPRPRIDGHVDEPFWSGLTPLDGFLQVLPVAGAEPSERTEVLLAYDERTLYIALLCYDREPHLIRATQMVRDARLDPDDRVELVLDSFNDKRNGFWFQIGPGGSKGDALVSGNGSSFNKQWDGIWDGAARVTERGWEAELAIPMATLNFDPQGTAWGFNLRRFIRRHSEEVRWASPSPRLGFFEVANAGELTGLRGLHQGLGLDVAPFVVTEYDRDRGDGDETTTGDIGLDAFWRLTPNTKLSMSVNTDFAQTEVDARQVNLSRFPLFFPEKRDFFLEDSGEFVFGGQGDVLPFFSRRIGLNDGDEVPLLGAAKLTGRTESFGFGVMDVQTDDSSGLDGQNLFVGRISKNVFERSSVGAIWTRGDPQGGGDADTYGADFNLATDTFRGDRNLQLSGYALRTDNEGAGSDDAAYRIELAYPNDEIELSGSALMVEDDFDPKLGFVPRRGIKRYDASLRYEPRINSTVRQLRFGFNPSLVTDTGNATESVDLSFELLGVRFESGEDLSFSVSERREVLDADFDITGSVTIPEDDYEFTRWSSSFETSEKRGVSLQSTVSAGSFYGGHREEYELDLDWRASRFVELGVEWEYNDVRLPGGDFDIHLGRVRATLAGSPKLSWSNFVQYDDTSDSLGLNSRLWWIPEPGNQLFLVLNQGWLADSDRFHGTETNVAFKVGYTMRF